MCVLAGLWTRRESCIFLHTLMQAPVQYISYICLEVTPIIIYMMSKILMNLLKCLVWETATHVQSTT